MSVKLFRPKPTNWETLAKQQDAACDQCGGTGLAEEWAEGWEEYSRGSSSDPKPCHACEGKGMRARGVELTVAGWVVMTAVAGVIAAIFYRSVRS